MLGQGYVLGRADLGHVGHPDPNYPGPFSMLSGPGLTPHEFARELLNSTSLALLSTSQALIFLLFCMRLIAALINQRRIEDTAAADREGVLFRGMGWLTIGMKFSMCDTTLGFVNQSFGLILTRRILRMIGRACVIIGVIKGFVTCHVLYSSCLAYI